MEMGGGRIYTPTKPPEDSPMNQKKRDISFRVSTLEDLIKGTVRMLDLVNLQIEFEKKTGHL